MKSEELSTKRLHEVLAQVLEEQIQQGKWGPGDLIPSARELAQQYGVSQTVVRDAIRSLAGKGLVRVQQGIGTSVSRDSGAGLVESYRWALRRRQVTRSEIAELGAILETQVAALAARRRTEADLSELERALQDCERLAPTGAREETSACHAQFHAAVLRAAHNQAVCAVLEPLSELILDSAEPQQSEGSFPLEQHQRLYRSIRAGDPEATRVAVEEHYANS